MSARRYLLLATGLFVLACTLPAATNATHVMLGPYEFEQSGAKVPRFFLIDDTRCHSIGALKRAVSSLPAGSRLVWRQSDADPPGMIHLGFPPMTIAGFKQFCADHRVEFSVRVQR
jgi:hypothetical protein